MPIIQDDGPQFIYKLGEIIHPDLVKWTDPEPKFNTDRLSGGSQLLPWFGGYLAVIHESRTLPGSHKRYYQHRFVYFGPDKKVLKISPPFFFHNKVIEFAAGLARHPDDKRIMISYGLEDKEAWIATVDNFDVWEFLNA